MDVLELRRKFAEALRPDTRQLNRVLYGVQSKAQEAKSRQRNRILIGPCGKLVIPDSVLTVTDQPTASFAVSITNQGNIRKLRQPPH
jgi:hypothetical protein